MFHQHQGRSRVSERIAQGRPCRQDRSLTPRKRGIRSTLLCAHGAHCPRSVIAAAKPAPHPKLLRDNRQCHSVLTPILLTILGAQSSFPKSTPPPAAAPAAVRLGCTRQFAAGAVAFFATAARGATVPANRGVRRRLHGAPRRTTISANNPLHGRRSQYGSAS